jgi:diguanylate cyclase (GGDEF)-like protein
MPTSPSDRSLVGPVLFGLTTLAIYSVLRAMHVVPRVEPWDGALLVTLPIAATGVMVLVRALMTPAADAHGFLAAEPGPRIATDHEPRITTDHERRTVTDHEPRITTDPNPRITPDRQPPIVSSEEPERPAPQAASDDAPELDAVLRFARELNASPEIDRLHAAISRELVPLLGYQDVWIVTRFGTRQRIILPEGVRSGIETLKPAQQWMTFPLAADGSTFGLLGIAVGQHRMSPKRLAVVNEVATLLAQALKTSEAFERMRETSTVDPLTGCSTRAHGLQRLEVELRRARRSGKAAGILLLDLDHFKMVNDRYGHPCGDAVLGQVGRTMMQTLRASDIRCRWGGEEFLVVLPETGLEAAKRVADSLCHRIADARVVYGIDEVRVTVSVGVTVTRPAEVETQNLLLRVDAALYRAKNEGRNCVRAVIGDLRGAPVARPPTGPVLPFPDRRDPTRTDRRRVAGFGGRRRTDRAQSNG